MVLFEQIRKMTNVSLARIQYIFIITSFIFIIFTHEQDPDARDRCLRKPDIRFIFCIAWPDAPFTRLSIADITTILPFPLSTSKPMSQKLEPRNFQHRYAFYEPDKGLSL